MIFYNNGELNDQGIIEAITTAMYMYEDGAIIECRDLLMSVCTAIDEFTYDYDSEVTDEADVDTTRN